MKNVLISLVILLIVPTLSYAEKSYFVACKEGTMVNTIYKQKILNFQRGDIFEIPTQALYKQGDKILNNDPREVCWSEAGETKCPLVVYYGNSGGSYQHGYVDLGSGVWFKITDNPIPIKSDAAEKLLSMFGSFVTGTKEGDFENSLDKEYVEVMCSDHPTNFEVAGYTFTDLKKEKADAIAKKIEENRLQQIALKEQTQKEQEEISRQLEQERAIVQQKMKSKSKTNVISTTPQNKGNKNNIITGAFGIKFGDNIQTYSTGEFTNYSIPVFGLEQFSKNGFRYISLKSPIDLNEMFPDTRSLALVGIRDDEDKVIVLMLNGYTGSWRDCSQIGSISAVRDILREKYRITKSQGKYNNNWDEEYGDNEGNSIKLYCTSTGEYSIKYTSNLFNEYIEILKYRKEKQHEEMKKSLKGSGL